MLPDAGAYHARTARIQAAERLGCPFLEFPGNHLRFIAETAGFGHPGRPHTVTLTGNGFRPRARV
ncbi:hypothetical protein [Nonomuraea sp. NPDC049400]|uniref:hypothetical protein n=1 Tax=Nonomuraea sp. NPDC049400 TaxID=3364352 RepID=UPI00378BB012